MCTMYGMKLQRTMYDLVYIFHYIVFSFVYISITCSSSFWVEWTRFPSPGRIPESDGTAAMASVPCVEGSGGGASGAFCPSVEGTTLSSFLSHGLNIFAKCAIIRELPKFFLNG